MVLKTLFSPASWCVPVILYVLLSVLSVALIAFAEKKQNGEVITRKEKLTSIAITILLSLVVMVVMLSCCEANMEWLAWLVLLIPLIYNIGRMSKCGQNQK